MRIVGDMHRAIDHAAKDGASDTRVLVSFAQRPRGPGRGGGPRKSRGYGLDVLKWTTDQALDGNPELVQLVTWNDFNESTCFEPTVDHGYQFVDALEKWWGEKTGRAVNLRDNRAAFEEYKRRCSDIERAEIPVLPAGMK